MASDGGSIVGVIIGIVVVIVQVVAAMKKKNDQQTSEATLAELARVDANIRAARERRLRQAHAAAEAHAEVVPTAVVKHVEASGPQWGDMPAPVWGSGVVAQSVAAPAFEKGAPAASTAGGTTRVPGSRFTFQTADLSEAVVWRELLLPPLALRVPTMEECAS